MARSDTMWRLAPMLLCLSLTVAGCRSPVGGDEEFTFDPETPPSYAADGLRLATLNTAFLFDGMNGEGGASFPHKGDTAAARSHRSRIGTIIHMLDADLVMLQEVENRRVLDLMVRELLSDMDYAVHFVEGTDTFTGQDVALLARVPIDTVGRIEERAPVGASDETYGVSRNLFARLDLESVATTIVGVHLLAFPLEPNRRPRREAQAAVIAQFAAREAAAGRALAILGDFNDFDDAIPDRHGSRPVTDVLKRIKAAGPEPEDDLRSVMAEVPRQDRYTAHYDHNRNGRVDAGELSAIDHVLLSHRLYRLLQEVHYVQAYDPLTYTDHFPIVVTLDVALQPRP